MHKRLDLNPRYKNFINARDRVLEKLLANAQAETSDILNQSLQKVISIIAARYSQIPEHEFFTNNATRMLKLLEGQIDDEFYHAAMQVYVRQIKMRKRAYILSALGETEAIGRTLEKPTKIQLTNEKLLDVQLSKKDGEDLVKRIRLGFNRLKRDIMDALELSRVQELPLGDAIKKVIAVFPKVKATVRPPNELARITEADAPYSKLDERKKVASVDSMSPDEWEDTVQDYKSDYLPKSRFYNEPMDWTEGDERSITYSWEVEQQLTDDFVSQVRDAQAEAGKQAKEQGISDFVWIAVIDDKTDECCSSRDGLTTEEIEAQMESGKLDADLCDASTPPAHFGCRCRLAPIADAKEVPEENQFDYEGFKEWLDQ